MKKLYTSLFLLILISFGIQGFTSIHFHRSIFPSFSTKEITIDSLLINTYNNTLLSQFYKEHQYQTVWTNKSQRETLIEEILRLQKVIQEIAINFGLEPNFAGTVGFDVDCHVQVYQKVKTLGGCNP